MLCTAHTGIRASADSCKKKKKKKKTTRRYANQYCLVRPAVNVSAPEKLIAMVPVESHVASQSAVPERQNIFPSDASGTLESRSSFTCQAFLLSGSLFGTLTTPPLVTGRRYNHHRPRTRRNQDVTSSFGVLISFNRPYQNSVKAASNLLRTQ